MAQSAPDLNADAVIALLLELLSVPGRSGDEQAVADLVVHRLVDAGLPQGLAAFDAAHRKSPLGGRNGNLIVKLPGTVKGPRRLFMAHLDTVPLCLGARPVIRGDEIVSIDSRTALGGDNRAGCAVILQAALHLLRHRPPHPPVTFVWTVQEEVGLLGARHLATAKLGRPSLCFNWDGGAPHRIVLGATGADHLEITVHGLASHAGAHPEDGVSAVAIAGLAIADLQQQGWHGKIVQGRRQGTSNIGSVNGGAATNVVTDHLALQAEVRSHQAGFRQRIVSAYRRAFQTAAKQTKNRDGRSGSVTVEVHHKYDSFRLKESDPSASAARRAIESLGLTPHTRIIDGGLDANWMTAHGLPTVTLGCGQSGIHTVNETLKVDEYLQACRIARWLAQDA